MHANYFMYTVPGNGTTISPMPNTSNMSIKHQTTTVSHQNATITNQSTAVRSSGATPNTVYAASTLQNVQNNQQNALANTVYVCQICCQSFTKSAGLKKHMKVHQTSQANDDNSPYKCNACKIDYHNAISFENHIKTEHGQPQAFKCVDCGCFRSVELTAEQPFRCEGCSRRKSEPFERTGALNYRVTSNTNATSSQQVHVNHIKTPKLDMDILVQSMRTGIEQTNGRRRKMHQCPDCDKCYKHQSTLAMHKKIHTGEYKYKCEYCDKEFYLAEYYNRHMRVHTKEKPYRCDICDKAFSQSNTLIQHKRIHTGEKPYPCTICGKSFSVRDYLLKHIRVHTGEKPFECNFCGKKYTQRSGLKSHQKSHYPEQNLMNGSQSPSHAQLQQLHNPNMSLI